MEKLSLTSISASSVHQTRRFRHYRPDRVLVLLLLFATICIFLRSNASPPTTHIPSNPEPLIPAQVWQLYTTVGPRIANTTHQNALKATRIAANLAATWFPVDGNWSYRFIGTEFGTHFVKEHFRGQPDVVDVYNSLRVPVMASDFLRYLLLAGDGGVYADSDVEMIKPLQDWVPVPYRNVARAMIGVEKDHPAEDEPDGWSFRFVQHTLITAKAHPIMINMVRNITDKMLQLSHEKDTPLSQLELHDRDVVRITGPRGFKDVVFEHLSGEVGESIGWRNVTQMKEPKLFGDTLIVPINFFAAGQQHSGSDGTSPDKRVQHYWSGTWRHWDESM
ncbi:MAG: hypothetical protein L6R35_005584 [Caloplaca aegaea]|nr:MAG: hypothetical protein L6R35_005584 [Caloplaca aegaea]